MSIIDVLLNPGAAIGCVVGLGAAAALHWAFPSQDLVVVQAVIVIAFCVFGHVIEHKFDGTRNKDE